MHGLRCTLGHEGTWHVVPRGHLLGRIGDPLHARGAVIHGEVEIKFVASQLNLADLFTKPLVPVLFLQHRKTLGVVPRPVL
jgi:hypothetical protein